MSTSAGGRRNVRTALPAPSATILKRQRETDMEAFRQHLSYAADDPLLYRRHRDLGMKRNLRLTLTQWVWLLVNLPGAFRSPAVRHRWVRAAGTRVGRPIASARQGIIYL